MLNPDHQMFRMGLVILARDLAAVIPELERDADVAAAFEAAMGPELRAIAAVFEAMVAALDRRPRSNAPGGEA